MFICGKFEKQSLSGVVLGCGFDFFTLAHTYLENQEEGHLWRCGK